MAADPPTRRGAHGVRVGCGGAVGRWRARPTELTGDCQGFRGTLGAKAGDPEAKGLVERLHDYLERSFLPGRHFTSSQDFSSQLSELLGRASSRQHRVLGCRLLIGSMRIGRQCWP